MKIIIILSILIQLSSEQIIIQNNSTTGNISYQKSSFGQQFTTNIYGYVNFVMPNNGCGSIMNTNISNNIAIIQRGGCLFADKVLNAQIANYIAVIVYDNMYDKDLISMDNCGYSNNITIPSVFISFSNSKLIKGGSFINIQYYESSGNMINIILIVSFILFCIFIGIIILIKCKTTRNRRVINIKNNNIIFNINEIIIKIDTQNNVQPFGEDTESISTNSDSTTCIICKNNDNLYKFKNREDGGCDCNIIFHESCMKDWFTRNPSCPACRKVYFVNLPIDPPII